jgi:cytochrome c
MKRIWIATLALAFLAACNSGEEPKTEEKKEEAPAQVDITETPEYKKGLELIGQSDCFTCHSVADKMTGPSYKDVANKYASAGDTIVTHLAKKIIAGGSGVWGQIPMAPHPNISQEDAEAMVKYVLLLKQ